MYQYIFIEEKDSVATITLNRPEAGNAFALESYLEVKCALEKLSRDENIRVVVITGAGKHFSAGGDIRRFKANIEKGDIIRPENVVRAGAMTDAVMRCAKPVVAMVNGAAIGAGCALALACDFRVVTPKSKLGLAFVNMGCSGDTGALYLLSRLVGTGKVRELMMLGQPVAGEDAVKFGLASRLAQGQTLQAETDQLVKELLSKPTAAIARQKRLLYEFFYRDYLLFNLREGDYMAECSLTQDHAEAVNAFLEKRTPQFIGK